MEERNKKEQRALNLLVLIFFIFSAGAITAGYLYYSNYKTQYKAEVGKQLTVIGKLKATDLADWRRERLGDASTFHKNTAFSKLVSKYFNEPNNADVRDQLEAWLSQFHRAYKDSNLMLIDAQGVERISVPEISKAEASDMAEHAVEILSSSEVTFLDFHRHSPNSPIYLGVLAPLLDAADNKQPIGVLVMRLHPAEY